MFPTSSPESVERLISQLGTMSGNSHHALVYYHLRPQYLFGIGSIRRHYYDSPRVPETLLVRICFRVSHNVKIAAQAGLLVYQSQSQDRFCTRNSACLN